jgi:Helix-loop-helix DNA-binding domain
MHPVYLCDNTISKIIFLTHPIFFFSLFPFRTGKADRRAEHNAIERARRESLNVKFQQLAHALPNLQDDRRPSKSRIVEKALEWVRQTFIREQQYRHEIQQLRLDNEHLRAQLAKQSNLNGASSGLSDMDVPPAPPPVASASLDMLSFSNWNSFSAEYLFEPAPLGDDQAISEQQDDDDNSSNDGDFESERTTSFYGGKSSPFTVGCNS